MGAISFIEQIDRSSLTVTQEEWEREVEKAVAEIAERPEMPELDESKRVIGDPQGRPPRTPVGDEREKPRDDGGNDGGLLGVVRKPLRDLGRIFSDGETLTAIGGSGAAAAATAPRTKNAERSLREEMQRQEAAEREAREREQRREKGGSGGGSNGSGHVRLSAEEAAARQASAEAEEARRIGRGEFESVVEVLKGMFPALDREVIGDVVRMKEGR